MISLKTAFVAALLVLGAGSAHAAFDPATAEPNTNYNDSFDGDHEQLNLRYAIAAESSRAFFNRLANGPRPAAGAQTRTSTDRADRVRN